MPIRNTIDYTMGLSGKSGTAIPLPADWGILEATPQFGLCKPHDPKLWYRQDEGPHFYTFDRVFVKDLKLEVAVGGALDRDVNSDTQFTNIIDDANAVELSDIKLRITTYDQKKLSFSNVAVRTAAGVAFLGRWHNKALKQKELPGYTITASMPPPLTAFAPRSIWCSNWLTNTQSRLRL